MADMTAQERADFVRFYMEERQQQGYSMLEAHSYAVQQLAMLEERRAEAEQRRQRINEQWSGLACSHCCQEYSKSIVRRTQGYCPDCGRRLGNVSGGRNPYPIKRKRPAEGSAANASK